MSVDFDGIKRGQRMMWAQGDFAEFSKGIRPVGELLAEKVGAAPGQRLLDVATGSGNVAIPAARAGAEVTGLDITPELLEDARAWASEEGLQISFIEGDAEQLPFADATFERLTSCFGVMFAPRQPVAARELLRVTAPGGRMAIAAWTPEGLMGEMFKTIASYMPPPPAELLPPVMWGVEDHVRGLFEPGAELTFERHSVAVAHDTPESWVAFNEQLLGPFIVARAALEPQGRYEQLRAELIGLYSEANEATDGSFAAQGEYLVTLADLPA